VCGVSDTVVDFTPRCGYANRGIMSDVDTHCRKVRIRMHGYANVYKKKKDIIWSGQRSLTQTMSTHGQWALRAHLKRFGLYVKNM